MEEKTEHQKALRRALIRGMKQAVEIVLEHKCYKVVGATYKCGCVDEIAHNIEKAIERKRGLDN